MLKIRIVPFLILLLLAGCRENELINKVTVEEEPPVVLVVSSFKGKVLDENGQPVPGARVRVYGSETTTDQNGLFEFKNIEAPKDAALVQVEKDGYFTGGATSGSRSGGQQYARVTLMKKGASQSVSSVSGGTLTWPDGLQVKIAPNSLRRANGVMYNSELEPRTFYSGNIFYDRVFRDDTGMGLWISYTYDRRLTDRLRWLLSANAQVPLQPVTDPDYALVQRFFNFGVQAGLVYQLKKGKKGK